MIVAITGQAPDAGHPRRRRAFMALAEACVRIGLPLWVTTPERIAWRVRQFSGWHYQPGAGWRTGVAALQRAVVYDGMYLADLRACAGRYRTLLRRLDADRIPCFNPVLPAKDVLYAWLAAAQADSTFSVPRTWPATGPGSVLRALAHAPCVWFKPTVGSGGRNIARVERVGPGQYRVVAPRFFGHALHTTWTRAGIISWSARACTRRRFMLQEDLPLVSTRDGRKVDFRVTLQRDATGDWTLTAVTARVAARGSVLTNLHAGGTAVSLTGGAAGDWLQDTGLVVDLARVERAASAACRALADRVPRLGLLGVDVGVTLDGTAYVYDCNGRPGRDILTDAELDAFMHKLAGFASYLWRTAYEIPSRADGEECRE
ncbi:hypothetical protein GCM10010885_05470 [Alicyclobacillus cellulosilyticus]|uniref:YheC/D-like protein n=1 Tax=Alicyclobacillus cellulosilyticus TaxID=1003997 RepID=A0A917K2Q5_9BACL|nr:YheC/YheD family protein [Alicyclobacillus cellulosilyticus]GGI98866.1 hypothetical protein GCM10010885_05470 [Alicyclobacillus cellulosilyticus]